MSSKVVSSLIAFYTKSIYTAKYILSPISSASRLWGHYYLAYFAGEEKALEVQEPESAEGEDDEEEEEEKEGEADRAAGAEEEEPLAATDESRDLPESCKPKMKLFTGKSAAGLRIRSEPSRVVSQIFLRGMQVWVISMPRVHEPLG